MTEWGVVGVIVTLIGLVVAIATPMVKLNTTLTRLSTQMENFVNGLEAFKKRYTDQVEKFEKEHGDIREELSEHEKRIIVLESKNRQQPDI